MTKTESLIVEVKEAIASLNARADLTERAVDRIDADSVRERLARLETRQDQFELQQRDRLSRGWALWLVVISTILSAILTVFATRSLEKLWP